MMMPRMGGYPVLEHFRDKPDAPPIIMITANEGSRHKAYAEYLGVVEYIRKPFAMEKLMEAVHRGLDPKVAAFCEKVLALEPALWTFARGRGGAGEQLHGAVAAPGGAVAQAQFRLLE